MSSELPRGFLSSHGTHPAPHLSPGMFPAEVPVRIVSSNKEAPHSYVVGQRVDLWCQLSCPVSPVCWYKDGEEVEVGETLVLEQEGLRYRLVLPCARMQDTGEFICNARDASVSYSVLVAGWWHCRDILERAALPQPCALGSPALLPALSIVHEGVQLCLCACCSCP